MRQLELLAHQMKLELHHTSYSRQPAHNLAKHVLICNLVRFEFGAQVPINVESILCNFTLF